MLVLSQSLEPAVFGVSFLIASYALGWLTHRRLLRRIRKAHVRLAEEQSGDARAGVSDALAGARRMPLMMAPLDAFTGHSVLDEAAKVLLEYGEAGTVLRLSEDDVSTASQLTPLDVQFEPVPLGTKPPELTTDGEVAPAQLPWWRKRWTEATRPFGRSLGARIWLATSLVVAPIGLSFMLIDSVRQLIAGTVPSYVTAAAMGALVVMPLSLLWLAFPKQWLVVPGGIIVRTATWRSAEWKLHIFRREECVLLHWIDTNMLAVAGENGQHFTRRVSPAVADFAIRAWLSPLEPPAAERLSDLV